MDIDSFRTLRVRTNISCKYEDARSPTGAGPLTSAVLALRQEGRAS
ncbi:hypothetical protein EV286_106238 [Rhizobium sp. BK251]|nr:hypothetical protein EV286_106238 [Rhizobium sp. BK251]